MEVEKGSASRQNPPLGSGGLCGTPTPTVPIQQSHRLRSFQACILSPTPSHPPTPPHLPSGCGAGWSTPAPGSRPRCPAHPPPAGSRCGAGPIYICMARCVCRCVRWSVCVDGCVGVCVYVCMCVCQTRSVGRSIAPLDIYIYRAAAPIQAPPTQSPPHKKKAPR